MVNCKSCGNPFDEFYGICPKCGTRYAPEDNEAVQSEQSSDKEPKPVMPPVPDAAISAVPPAAENIPAQPMPPLPYNGMVQNEPPTKPKKKKNKAKIIILILVIAAILAGCGVGSYFLFFYHPDPGIEERVNEQLSLGEKYMKEKNYTEAIKAYKKAAEIDSDNAELYSKLSEAYQKAGDDANALKALENGYAATKNDALKAKLEALQAEIEAKKKETQFNEYVTKADTAYAASQYDEAIVYYERAIEIKDAADALYLKVAECYIAQKQLEKAADILTIGYEKTNSTALQNKINEINSALEAEQQKAQQKLEQQAKYGFDVNTVKDAIAEEAASKGNKPVKIRMWCSADDRDFEKQMVEEYKQLLADDRYSFEITVVAKGEDGAGAAVLEAPNKSAAVFSFTDDQLNTLAENGAIAPVMTLVAENVKAANSEKSIAVSSFNNKLYAYPKTCDNGYFLYYDKRVFSEEDVKSMETMIAKANAKGKNVYMNLGNAWYNAGFFFAAGCTLQYENGKQTATLNTPEGLAAAKAMCALAKYEGKGLIGSPGTAGDSAYAHLNFSDGGTVCAAVIGTWMGPSFKKQIGAENLGAAKLPTVKINGKDTQLHSFDGYKLIGVNTFAEYPFAAQALACYLSSNEVQLKRYQTKGLLPTNIQASESDEVKDDPATRAINDQKPFAHAQGTSVGISYWAAGVGDLGAQIISKKGSISNADLQKMLQECVEKMK